MRRAHIIVLAVVLAAGGIAGDHFLSAAAPRPRAVRPISPGGVWGCPFVYAGNGRAWVHVANISDAASKVSVGFVRDAAPVLFQSFRLAGRSAKTVPFPAGERRASGAVIQFAGGEIYASRMSVFSSRQGGRGGIGAPCVRAGERSLVLPSGSTLRSETELILLNPSSSDAAVDVTLVAGGTQTQPEGLKNQVVSAYTRRVFRLSDFSFDTRTVAALISVRSGAITADGILSSDRGVTVTPAVPPGRSMVALGETHSGTMFLDAVAPGDEDSLVEAAVSSPDEQSALAALATGIPADSPVSQPLPPSHFSAAGLTVGVREGAPIAAAARWIIQDDRGRADVSASMAVPPARRCVAVIGAPATVSRTHILLLNPGETAATVSIELLESDGPHREDALRAILVPPGRTVAVPIGRLNGPSGVVATSTEPIGMAVAGSSIGPDVTPFARIAAWAVTGLPVPQPAAVSVEGDPRLGVPAP